MKVVVVGAGVAGLCTAWALARRGVEVRVLDSELQAFSHASGNNAAIYRPLESMPGLATLAFRSAELFDELLGAREGWLAPRGLVLVAQERQRTSALLAVADRDGVGVEVWERDTLWRELPELVSGRTTHGLFIPAAGVLDPHAISTALSAALRRLGGKLELGAVVASLNVSGSTITGVTLADGTRHEADAVVLAAGAWSGMLAANAGLPLPLVPMRRHLVLVEPPTKVRGEQPTVWDVELECYFRPESAGILASPCDETACPDAAFTRDDAALELLERRFRALAPGLADARVRRSWACLRTFAPDRSLVLGPDTRAERLFWSAGLGGFGMSCGAALGELTARTVVGERPASLDVFSVARLMSESSAKAQGTVDSRGG